MAANTDISRSVSRSFQLASLHVVEAHRRAAVQLNAAADVVGDAQEHHNEVAVVARAARLASCSAADAVAEASVALAAIEEGGDDAAALGALRLAEVAATATAASAAVAAAALEAAKEDLAFCWKMKMESEMSCARQMTVLREDAGRHATALAHAQHVGGHVGVNAVNSEWLERHAVVGNAAGEQPFSPPLPGDAGYEAASATAAYNAAYRRAAEAAGGPGPLPVPRFAPPPQP